MEISNEIYLCNKKHRVLFGIAKMREIEDFAEMYGAMGRYKWGHLVAYYALVYEFSSLKQLEINELTLLLSITFLDLSKVEENWTPLYKHKNNYFALSTLITPLLWILPKLIS